LAVRVARIGGSRVEGVFCRHASPKVRTLTGTTSGGRWGPRGTFSVLYLGRPRDSVVVEAYRHLVDDIEGMTAERVGPRRLLVCQVEVNHVLDLRSAEAIEQVGLEESALTGAWDECHPVGQAAHQLGFHGILANAATGFGETLALFERHLEAVEMPIIIEEEVWQRLPADPRRLRVIRRRESS
jgi:hypothetical protein